MSVVPKGCREDAGWGQFVVNTATEHGFLAEQVDNSSLKSNWVVGLGWSHAMFIIALDSLNENVW